jgi:plasmid stability protein
MRTTLNINETLLQRLKVAAADSGHTLSELTEEAIRAYLTPGKSDHLKPVKLPTSGRDLGLRPGVDLDSNASLAEMMDEEYVEKMRAASRR